jgi:glycosyltransferase involved in cell wall biosynthesis
LTRLDSPGLRLAGQLKWRRRRNQLLASIPALARYLRRERPAVLMSAANHAHLSALWARRLSGTRVPLVLRVSNHLTHSHLGGTRRSRPLRLRLARRWYGWADAAVAVSRGIAEDLVTHTRLPARSVHTIYNPTYTSESQGKAEAANDHPWFGPGEPPVILGAGRLTPQKDFATLVRAFAGVRARRPARLIILGEGKQRREILGLARRLGVAADVELPGYVDNPFAWMSRAAVFVLSSVWEGFPGVLIEAMGCGCPVVSTDCPSGPAEILEGGNYGRLVPMRDEAALAEAIVAALRDPGSSERLRERAAEFSVDRALDHYLEVLLGVGERAAYKR